jgi:hypothetical protein
MSRGPFPSKGFDAAIPIAKARGHVEHFRRMRGNTADLMVSGGGLLAIIRIQNAPRLYGTPAEIAREFYDAIARLRLHPAGGPVSRELWLYSRYGVLRFFRVLDNGIVELGADGKVLAAGPVVPAPAGRVGSGKKMPAVQEQLAGEKNPAGPASCDETPALPGLPAAEKSPAVPATGVEAVPAVQGRVPVNDKPEYPVSGCDIVVIQQEPVAEKGPGGEGE